jgi:hypothetical protein
MYRHNYHDHRFLYPHTTHQQPIIPRHLHRIQPRKSSLIYLSFNTNNPPFPQFTLLSPCGFIATEYILLPRIAALIEAEDCLFLSSRKIVRIFVWSDVTTFFLQAAGGGMTAIQGNKTMQDVGKWVSAPKEEKKKRN